MNTEQDTNPEFERWWSAHGQFCRAGGGDYEKTFAFRAWQAGLKLLTPAHDRIFDLLLADDGQAWKEAAKYLERTNHPMFMRLQEQTPIVAGALLHDWRPPTKFLTRMGDAIQVMCRGHRPPDEMMAAWFDPEAEDDQLQHFAAEHGLAAQNVELHRLVTDAPSYFSPEHEFDGRKSAWLRSAEKIIARGSK